MDTFDIDEILFHAIGGGILTKRQASIAKKIYAGQRVIKAAIPGMMRLDDETVVEVEDLETFRDQNLLDILLRGRQLD